MISARVRYEDLKLAHFCQDHDWPSVAELAEEFYRNDVSVLWLVAPELKNGSPNTCQDASSRPGEELAQMKVDEW